MFGEGLCADGLSTRRLPCTSTSAAHLADIRPFESDLGASPTLQTQFRRKPGKWYYDD